ncbi:MAG TPA: patatin-like phospholipase family protein [Acetobacteraceae bacterium]|nr:patatin-like phospholipase family protein [Acetobacteraceae bacterium]
MTESTRGLSLGLQGGGSFGAFTWGVLDRLLEEKALQLDMVSGASAGAVNAVVLAAGLAEGGPQAAQRKLRRFWERVSLVGPLSGSSVAHAAAAALGSPVLASPYQFNPLGIDPLRDILLDEVDFAQLQSASPIRLLIAATRVRDGQARLFRETEISVDHVLASACLPFMHQAVEIDGEAYWDGGYSANPPLRQLVLDTDARDVLLVRLLPDAADGVPQSSYEIAQRVRAMAFNTPLLKEQESIAALRRSCVGQGAARSKLCRKLLGLHIHTIAAEDAVPALARESPLDTSSTFLTRLKERGRNAAVAWLRNWQAARWAWSGAHVY